MITLDLAPTLRKALEACHPWVYRDHVQRVPDVPAGTWLRLRCGPVTGYGLWDPSGAIAVRVFSTRGIPDSAWVADRVGEAWALRAPVRAGATTGYRWVYGESDGLPGVVVDLYGEFAAIRTYSESVEVLVPWVAEALHAHARLQGIVWRTAGGARSTIWGRIPPAGLTVEEHGLLFYADLEAGQKTGLYFDQRENRRFLRPWCEGKSVLDSFCYTGGFALNALRGGAKAVTLCDAAAGAVEAARRNLILNGFDPGQHAFVVHDCFDLLSRYAAEGRQFQVVIVDPPSLAHDRKSRHAAERAYVRLNRAAIRCTEPGGLLASSSCTSQVSPEAFRGALGRAAVEAGRRLQIVHEAGQAIDHPVPANFVEGRYLKFVVGRVLQAL